MLTLIARALLAVSPPPSLTTQAERTHYAESGRADEVDAFARNFPLHFPGKVQVTQFGTTPEGRPLWVFAASADGTLTPERARARGRPVVFALAGIHPGEVDGKDAGFLLLRELLKGTTLPGLLRHATFVFVPVFNMDGHEHTGPDHRPNQNGPRETGWRATSRNLNLNRDWMKADAPEMRALLPLLGAWDPLVFLDLHVTDGAHFKPDVSVLIAPPIEGPPAMREVARVLHDELLSDLRAGGHLPLDFYPALIRDDDPASGFSRSGYTPRFSQAYWGLRHRLAVLVETHSWKDYRTRVLTTRDVLVSVLRSVQTHGATWRVRFRGLDEETTRTPPRTLDLEFAPTTSETIDFPAYAYERVPSPATGGTYLRYLLERPETWRVPLRTTVLPTLTVQLPRGGWAIVPGWAETVEDNLRLHGILSTRLAAAIPINVEVFHLREIRFAPEPYEGRQRLTGAGEWRSERRTLPRGTLVVPLAQARAELAGHLLEPNGPDSLFSWGTFNAAFQQQEYVEAYLLEPWAEQALKTDAALRSAFEQRMADPAFAADAGARRRFFAERHPSFDTRIRELPVLRVTSPLGPER